MKTNRLIIGALSVLVLVLGYLQLSRPGNPKIEPPKDLWRTNTVAMWQTNILNLWHTNTLELWRTNTVVQNFTNEVIKEVAVPLSPAAKEAATVGFRYLNAPLSSASNQTLYRMGPIALDVNMVGSDNSMAAVDAGTVRKYAEGVLQTRGVPISASSPHRLILAIDPLWNSDVPKVGIVALRLDLRDSVTVQRQGDVIRFDAIVWSAAGSKFVRTLKMAEELNSAVQEQLDKFCDDYLKAKQTEQDVKSRIVPVPSNLFPGA